jgi:Flp pilus assembly protein TadD
MAQVYSRLGWVLTNQGSFPEARTALVRAIQLNPKHADTQALLGVVLEKLGDKPGALRQYQRALELNPQTEIAKEGLNRLSAQN